MNKVNGYAMYHDYSEKSWKKSNNIKSSEKAGKTEKGFNSKNVEKTEKNATLPETDQVEVSDKAQELFKEKELESKEKSEKSSQTKETELSDNAKALLKELQNKYQNVDFMVANYSSYEEAQKYLSKGTKEYSVLIEPELLEKMAEDPATKEKYIGLLEDSLTKLGDMLKDMENELGDDAVNVKNIGFSVKGDGEITYYAVLEKSNSNLKAISEKGRAKKAETKKAQKRADQKKSIKKSKEKKAEAKKAQKRADQKKSIEKNKEELAETQKAEKQEKVNEKSTTKTYVEANSISDLLEKIQQVDWEKLQESNVATQDMQRNHFDYSL